ncbi:MAG: long-chain fatty acid--CoA ligase [Actinobacteria bacterium]|nr:long-chain fatty acid--CoA ligase [Actinomycetota bacterium]MCL6104195.1 long-chain fatty acid--CoA ligase [Actinomycetota bacterium]
MNSTMGDFPLTITSIMRHGTSTYPDKQVVTYTGEAFVGVSFAEIVARIEKLAAALAGLGVEDGDRVATFCWNHQQHFEAYFAVPCLGAVLHTLNIRLFPDQLAYVISHAEDKVIIADVTLLALLAKASSGLERIKKLIVVGEGDIDPLLLKTVNGNVVGYEEFISSYDEGFPWPDLNENHPAGMCYTTGTTGEPKGVVYSHRSTYLHTMALTSSTAFAIAEADRVLPIVPMFHANCWGTPYTVFMAGADILLPDRFLQAPHIARMMEEFKPTLAFGVPTIWNDLLHFSDDHNIDMSSLRGLVSGGSAVPWSLMQAYQQRFGIPLFQAWGMTETSPLGSVARAPCNTPKEEEATYRATAGRLVPGVEGRIVDDEGNILPNDGSSVGELEVRGPWITTSYYAPDANPTSASDVADRFHDGWLKTGDVGTLDRLGFFRITDRSKDVIKSGGEWISSIDLENAITAHPKVYEAAVIAVPDERYQERPLACIVLNPDDINPNVSSPAEASPLDSSSDTKLFLEINEFLMNKVARWWLPERWAVLNEIPKTSVGKFDKKLLRAWYTEGKLTLHQV